MSRALLAALIAAVALALAGCGGPAAGAGEPDPDTPDSADAADGAGSPALGMCAEGVTDCVDVVVDPDGEVPDSFDVEAALAEARALLGSAEDELDEHVRVGRRGDEQMMLTEDYVLGRRTVELDADPSGVFRVVSVTVELPEGPQTVTE
jgi:hypothetical protein